jgi:uncharacterized protein (DUF1330 family)
MEGPPTAQRIAITGWESLDKAQAFFKSKAWMDLAPDRDKGTQDNSPLCGRRTKLTC